MGKVVSLARARTAAKRRASDGVPFVKPSPREPKAQDRDHARARYRAADRLRIAIRDCLDLGIDRHELESAFKWALDGSEEG